MNYGGFRIAFASETLFRTVNLNVIVPVETYGRTDVKKPEKFRLFICFMDLAEVRMTGWIIANGSARSACPLLHRHRTPAPGRRPSGRSEDIRC